MATWDYAFNCIVLFISSHILVCYLFTNVDVFQYSWVGLWIVVLHSMFYHDIWYSSLIYFGISLYVFILIRKLYHKVHFDKCKCTMWSLIKNCLDLLLLMCSLLLFDIVKGGEIWNAQAKDDQNALWHQLRGSELIWWLALVF